MCAFVVGGVVESGGASSSASGDVVGPAGASDGAVVQFDGATGKLVKAGPVLSAFAATILDDANAAAVRTTIGAGTGSGDVVGPSSSVDNAITRYDSTTGKLVQDSPVTVGDVAGSSVTVATIAGNAFAIVATAPAATTGASQAGKAASVTASAAVASTDTAGAAAGGDVTLTGGAAARNASGNANGGNIFLVPGAGIGTGTAGVAGFFGTTSSFPGLAQRTGSAQFQVTDAARSGRGTVWTAAIGVGGTMDSYTANDAYLAQGSGIANVAVRSNGQFGFVSGSDASQSSDTGVARNAAAVVRTTDGSTGIGALLTKRLVEANTAGSGAPNVLAVTESGTLLTNTGATAENYHTLPAATVGVEYHFYCADTDGIRVTANGSDTIRLAGSVSGAGGRITSTTIGSYTVLICHVAGLWVGYGTVGTWVVT